jgi:hypothetical protein
VIAVAHEHRFQVPAGVRMRLLGRQTVRHLETTLPRA